MSFRVHMKRSLLCYALVYPLILPLWIRVTSLLLFGHWIELYWLQLSVTGGVLLWVAACSRHYSSWCRSSQVLLAAGAILEIASVAKLLPAAVSHLGIASILLSSIIAAVWWSGVYFCDLSDLRRERNVRFGKKVVGCFIVCALALHGLAWPLSRYYGYELNGILSAGYEKGNAYSPEVEKAYHAMLTQAVFAYMLLILAVACLFVVLFSRIRRREMTVV